MLEWRTRVHEDSVKNLVSTTLQRSVVRGVYLWKVCYARYRSRVGRDRLEEVPAHLQKLV